MVTIKEVLEEYKGELMEPMMVLSKLLAVDKAYIYTHIDRELDREVLASFKDIMEKRSLGYPIQYLLKEREFMGLNLFIDEGVLVPRNDTETLVEYLIDYMGDRSLGVLELGVGSGAISIALGHYCKNASIKGVDISSQALEVARKNIDRFKLRNVDFVQGDLFQGLEGESFDIIVSNPPYIASDVIAGLDRQVRDFEPSLALDGGQDGLDFYRRITREAGAYLAGDGLLIFEIGYDQADSVGVLLREEGFKDIRVIKDLQGHDRVILGFLGED